MFAILTLVMLVAAVVAHICVPHASGDDFAAHHAHATGSGHHHHDDGSGGDEGVHAGLCDTIAATPSAPLVAVLTAWSPAFAQETPVHRTAPVLSFSAPAESPPLYIQHASLLI